MLASSASGRNGTVQTGSAAKKPKGHWSLLEHVSVAFNAHKAVCSGQSFFFPCRSIAPRVASSMRRRPPWADERDTSLPSSSSSPERRRSCIRRFMFSNQRVYFWHANTRQHPVTQDAATQTERRVGGFQSAELRHCSF